MILILAYWLFLFAFFLPAGILLKSALRLQTANLPITLLLGMLCTATTFSLTAFFFPLGWGALAAHCLILLFAGIRFRKAISGQLSGFRHEINSLTRFSKALLLFLIAGAALKSAQAPFILDNESYYVQTIKWINGYGFVKGLGNLHIFFAQSSVWHVLQAGLNFSFVTDRINDINSFVFISCLCYYIIEGEKRFKQSGFQWISFLPVYSVLLFLFIDSPSPDLPLLMITPVIIYLYAEGDDSDFKIAAALFLLLVFIKITIAPLGLLFLVHFLKDKRHFSFFAFTGLALFVIWCAKNIIITGYPFYPFGFKLSVPWAIPKEIITFISEKTAQQGYYKDMPAAVNDTLMQRLQHWLQLGGLAGVLNKFILVLFPAVLLLPGIRKSKKYSVAYIAFLVHFTLLLLTSPQFRFFLPEIIIFSAMLIAFICGYFNSPVLGRAITRFTAICTIVLFINVPFSSLTSNKFHQSLKPVSFAQIYLPEKNTSSPAMEFVNERIGRLNYYSPKKNFFLFGTSNGPLPCVNRAQVDYLQKHFGYIPQPLGKNLNSGFYSARKMDK